jgi:hypothetical protein
MFDLFKNVVGSPCNESNGPGTNRVESPTQEALIAKRNVGQPSPSVSANKFRRVISDISFPRVLLWVALVLASTSHPGLTAETNTAASLTELRSQVSQLLRSESVADDQRAKQQALTALCDLYVVLRKDERYADSEMLQQDAGKIRRRLLTAARSITARQRRLKIPRPENLRQSVDDAIEAARESVRENGPTQAGWSGLALDTPSMPQSVSASDRLSTLAQGRQAAGAFDNGWQLVELIQRIVAPDFWQDSGGPGVVTYFAMRRVLVVRATSDVHEQIRDLLLSLPR